MAAKKKSVAEATQEVNTEATQEVNTEAKKPETYKIVGKGYEDKAEANKAIREAHKKGFRNTGLCVKGNEFVLLFGTYNNTEATDCFIATQFSQSCKHLHSYCRCLVGQAGR